MCVSRLCCNVDLFVFCLGVLMCKMLCFRVLSMMCVFKHLYCSAKLSVSNMEKRYRSIIIIIIIIIIIHEYMYTQVYTRNIHTYYGENHFIASYTSRRLPYP